MGWEMATGAFCGLTNSELMVVEQKEVDGVTGTHMKELKTDMMRL